MIAERKLIAGYRWFQAGRAERRLRRRGVNVDWVLVPRRGRPKPPDEGPKVIGQYVNAATGKLVIVVQ